MKAAIQRPSIFLRLFLSHLLMLLFSFGVGLFVFDALFAPGLRPFLQRSPAILVPAVLALIGVAGLLAVWTATGITHPLERITKCVEDDDAASDLADIASSAPLEVAELAEAIAASQRAADAAPARVDTEFMVMNSSASRENNLVGMTASPDPRSDADEVASSASHHDTLRAGEDIDPSAEPNADGPADAQPVTTARGGAADQSADSPSRHAPRDGDGL